MGKATEQIAVPNREAGVTCTTQPTCHVGPHLLCHHEEEVDHVLRLTSKLGSQLRVLQRQFGTQGNLMIGYCPSSYTILPCYAHYSVTVTLTVSVHHPTQSCRVMPTIPLQAALARMLYVCVEGEIEGERGNMGADGAEGERGLRGERV